MRAVISLALLGACSAPPAAKPAPIAIADEDAAPPPPTCAYAVDEFILRVGFYNETEVRDGLIGECIDLGWRADERRCVRDAAGLTGLAECVITSTRLMVASPSEDGAVGIPACDRVVATYRRCMTTSTSINVTIASDTQEALELTVGAWKERAAPGAGGWDDVQRECGLLAAALPQMLSRYGCE